ncbi:hypothetical protein H4W81_007274 [Nonomuraea africana]|uniref:Uncharacterized protein n=1 Tax=Nonomuraea africana TaxID=46171 RepID=A0ABR9KRY8_9ACTN|nr:hypothetical protein [Nonomuraea africana]
MRRSGIVGLQLREKARATMRSKVSDLLERDFTGPAPNQ